MSPPTPVPCPTCARPNAPHKVHCLYCGAKMPNPTAPPPKVKRSLPRELDKALERALRGGDLGQAMEVLAKLEDGLPSEAPESPKIVPFQKAPVSLEVARGAPDPQAILAEMEAALDALKAAFEDDPQAASEALDTLQEGAQRLRPLIPQPPEAEPEPPAPPAIVLPPIRKPWMLVVDPPGSLDEAARMAAALRLDVPTARLHARAPFPRAALRSDDRADLEHRAQRYRDQMGLAAVVVGADDLLGLPPAQTVLSMTPGTWTVAGGALWDRTADELRHVRGSELAPFPVQLVVVGDVQIRTFRDHHSARGLRRRDSVTTADRSVAVADLHGQGRILRVVAGLTELGHWPGVGGRSATLAFRAWLESLPQHWPEVRVLGKRVCPPGDRPASAGEEGVEAAVSTGWPLFEEHSRASALLLTRGATSER